MMRTAVFKLSGQPDSGPMGVLDQSRARIKEPISPPPENTVAAAEVGSAVAVSAGSLTAFNELTGSRWLLVYGDRREPALHGHNSAQSRYLDAATREPRCFRSKLLAGNSLDERSANEAPYVSPLDLLKFYIGIRGRSKAKDLISRVEAIAYPRLGDQVAWHTVIRLEFLAQVAHENTEIFWLLHAVRTPNGG